MTLYFIHFERKFITNINIINMKEIKLYTKFN